MVSYIAYEVVEHKPPMRCIMCGAALPHFDEFAPIYVCDKCNRKGHIGGE